MPPSDVHCSEQQTATYIRYAARSAEHYIMVSLSITSIIDNNAISLYIIMHPSYFISFLVSSILGWKLAMLSS